MQVQVDELGHRLQFNFTLVAAILAGNTGGQEESYPQPSG
jgi:hypothetical protein